MINLKNVNFRSRLILVAVLLAFALVFVGCSNDLQEDDLNNNLTVTNSTVSEQISSDLDQIILTFNKEIAEFDIASGLEDFDIELNGKDVVISNLQLENDQDYLVKYTATATDNSDLSGKLPFSTNTNETSAASMYSSNSGEVNRTLMQTFYWEMNEGDYATQYPEESDLWNLLANRAGELAEVGITSLWLPPANKAFGGGFDVGYGTYDLWDLGEFDQKGTVRTKYGTRNQLENAISALDGAGLEVLFDVVFNHRMGADETEWVQLSQDSPSRPGEWIQAYTKFNLAGRQAHYSRANEWQWDSASFTGTDWDAATQSGGRFLFEGKTWANTYEWDDDYLMGANVDYYNYGPNGEAYANTRVIEEMMEWGEWITNEIGFSGFRMDATKHIDNNFIRDWINHIQANTSHDAFFVAEAWINDVDSLKGYMDSVGTSNMHVFDFPLREAFGELRDGNLDMRWLGGRGLVNGGYGYDYRAVTFTDNHDTSRDHNDYGVTPINNRAYQAYTYIMMREFGTPTIFWKDYYQFGMKDGLDKLIEARRDFAYGPGYEVDSNDYNTYSYVRAGSADRPGSGLVMMITQETHGGDIYKWVNARQPNTTYYDYTGNVEGTVTTNDHGWGEFRVRGTAAEGWSVWVPVQ